MSEKLKKKFYDEQSDCFLQPPSETWNNIQPHKKKEIKKTYHLKDTENKVVNSKEDYNFLKTFKAFTLDNVLSEEECKHFIKETEAIGYEKLYGYHPSYRNNTRIIIQDLDLVDLIFNRIKDFVPQTIEEDGKTWTFCGMNERFRWCKYDKGQHFNAHLDANFTRNLTEKSFFTFMIYLNDVTEGGCTRFLSTDDKSVVENVRPATGAALIFPHRVFHDGEKLLGDLKYLCRSDLMYRLEGKKK
jgi:hypothetical protein